MGRMRKRSARTCKRLCSDSGFKTTNSVTSNFELLYPHL